MNSATATALEQQQKATAAASASASTRRALKPGEWACVDAKCAHINAEFRHTCDNCGKTKPRAKNRIGREIGKDAAEKSKGLFAAEDWACTKCGNINWARRTTCNICNAPKLGDLEVRTGYGGGYMDREDVEYIEREDDEVFDEFGRKKKKRRFGEGGEEMDDDDDEGEEGQGGQQQQQRASEKKGGGDDQQGGEEDEEEDEEDEDLDKYDLTADPELVAKVIVIPRTRNAEDRGGDDSSRLSSDCSCSCSGGDCSCEESEGDSREMVERRGGGRGDETSRSTRGETRGESTRDRGKDKTRTENEYRRRSRSRDRGSPRRGGSYRDRR